MATVATPMRFILSWSRKQIATFWGELCFFYFQRSAIAADGFLEKNLIFWMDWKSDQNSNDLRKKWWQIFGDLEDRAPRLGKWLITMISW